MSLERIEACPICDGASFHPHLTCKDFTTSSELFHVEQCDNCGLLLTNPRPTIQNAGSYYKSTNYISHQSAATSIFDTIYLIIRRLSLNWKCQIIKQSIQTNPLLDFGCGTGAFLTHCKKRGIECVGVEPSEEARRIAADSKLNVYDSLNNLPEGTYDVITLWHVLEHVYPVADILQKLKSKLAKDGIIIIAVPNWQSSDATHYKQFWAGYDVPRHVWHFSKNSMTALLQTAGFRVNKIIPMKLDAYYVSLLSEKYVREGNLSIMGTILGIIHGIQSNIAARKQNNYSSLIYIANR